MGFSALLSRPGNTASFLSLLRQCHAINSLGKSIHSSSPSSYSTKCKPFEALYAIISPRYQSLSAARIDSLQETHCSSVGALRDITSTGFLVPSSPDLFLTSSGLDANFTCSHPNFSIAFRYFVEHPEVLVLGLIYLNSCSAKLSHSISPSS